MPRKAPGSVLLRKGVLRNFAKVTGKHMYQGLFLITLQADACNFIKEETLAQVCFPVNFAKFQKTSFFTEHLWWPLLNVGIMFKIENRHHVLPLTSFRCQFVCTSCLVTFLMVLQKIFLIPEFLQYQPCHLKELLTGMNYSQEIKNEYRPPKSCSILSIFYILFLYSSIS